MENKIRSPIHVDVLFGLETAVVESLLQEQPDVCHGSRSLCPLGTSPLYPCVYRNITMSRTSASFSEIWRSDVDGRTEARTSRTSTAWSKGDLEGLRYDFGEADAGVGAPTEEEPAQKGD